MGLAPSGSASLPRDSSSREVPVPIFSQPLRESTHFRGAKGDVVFPTSYSLVPYRESGTALFGVRFPC